MHSFKLKRCLLPLSCSYSSFDPSRFFQKPRFSTSSKPSPPPPSSISNATADDDWNDAWETAWLPDDPSPSSSADVTLPSSVDVIASSSSSEIDADTKAFVAEMDERWNERRAAKRMSSKSKAEDKVRNSNREEEKKGGGDEYRLRKQRIHAGLWIKEIEKMEEAKLGDADAIVAGGDEIDRLLDSCSEFFDSGNIDLNDTKMPNTSEFKSKPDGWETTTKTHDGNVWEISQREEDILLQEFERRIAFSKFQIASFIKTHIFSRRRPIDGWKYMIEELGPNARRGKGSVQRLPSLVDPSTQPFKEDKRAIAPNILSSRGR